MVKASSVLAVLGVVAAIALFSVALGVGGVFSVPSASTSIAGTRSSITTLRVLAGRPERTLSGFEAPICASRRLPLATTSKPGAR